MKKILSFIFILTFFIGGSYAKKYYPAVISKHDGTQIECLAVYPKKADEKKISFKTTKDAKAEKIESLDIKSIRYFEDDRIIDLEYNYQIAYHNAKKENPKVSKPAWMSVIMRGPVTLYLVTIITQNSNGSRTTENYYFCKREDERAATCVAMAGLIQIGNPFPKIGAKYFADNPRIAEKILNKEKGYTSKNIEEIVMEYNAEHQTKGR